MTDRRTSPERGEAFVQHMTDQMATLARTLRDWVQAETRSLYGEGSSLRVAWAQQWRDALWKGQVAEVFAALEPYRSKGDGVTAALSYFTTHQTRMDYPRYRARGLQIGSGTIERACKQLMRARLKLAGMIWDAEGAEAVVVRAWLKSDRWGEALRLRPPPQRAYRRQAAPPTTSAAAA